MHESEHPLLGKNHLRSITATLELLDELLDSVARWADGVVAQGPLHEEVDDLSAEQKARLHQELARLRSLLAELRENYGLPHELKSVRATIWGQCVWFRENLYELGSPYLKRYGPLPEGFAADFDNRVARLIEGLNNIGSIAQEEPKDSPSPKD